MKRLAQVAFIIQARLGSERLPGKMSRPFAGTTLLDIALEKVRHSTVIPRENFYLAVHEKELVDVARRHGVQVFARTLRSARGEDLLEVYEWHDQLPHDYVVKINACAPFLPVATIDAFVRQYLASPYDGLFGVVEERDYFWNAEGVLVTPWPKDLKIMNTKRVGVTYRAAHCLYAGRRDRIADGEWMGTFQRPNDPALFPMTARDALDIDHPWQFEMCEAYYVQQRQRAAAQHRELEKS
jgi:CMP-N-acetylneuraminic acid synthetase